MLLRNEKLKFSYIKYDILWLIVDPQKLFVKRQQTPKAEAHGPSSVPSKAVHSEKLRNFITIVSLDLLLFIKITIKVVIEKSCGGRFLRNRN